MEPTSNSWWSDWEWPDWKWLIWRRRPEQTKRNLPCPNFTVPEAARLFLLMSPEYCDGFVRLLRRVDAQTGRKMLTSKAVLAFMVKEKLPLATILRPEVLGHPNTLAVMGDLATDYISAGRHDRAIGLEEATFQLCQEALGEKHPDTLGSMGRLASYRSFGRHDEPIEEATLPSTLN